MADVYRILIQSGFDEAGARAADQALGNLEKKAKGVADAGKKIGEGFKLGLGIDLQGRVIGALEQIPRFFASAVQEGIRFNATVESATLGIAAMLRQFEGGRFTTFDSAMTQADKVVELVKQKAAATNVTFEQLLMSYQASVGKLYAANVTDIKQQIDLVGLLANAVSAVIPDQGQLLQETRAIITGNITSDAVAAQTFGITPQDIKTATEAGRLAQFLTEKLKAFNEAGEAGAKTWNVALGNLGEKLTDIAATLSKSLFEVFRTEILNLNDTLGSQGFKDSLQGLADLTRGVKSLYDTAAANGGTIGNVMRAIFPRATTIGTMAGNYLRERGEGIRNTRAGAGINALGNPGNQSTPKPEKPQTDEEFKAVTRAVKELADTFKDLKEAQRDALPDEQRLLALRTELLQARQGLPEDMSDSEIAGFVANSESMGAAQKTEILKQLKNIAELQEKIDELVGKQVKEAADAADEEEKIAKKAKEVADAKKEALAEADLEQQVLRAEVAGHTRIKIELEAQLTKLREKAQLMSKHVPEAEAAKQAEITAELQKQKALKEQMDKQAKAASELDADQAIRKAQAKGDRRGELHAQADKVGVEVANKAREAGLEDWAQRGQAAAETEERRLRREAQKNGERLRFGGTSAADPSTNRGAVRSGFDTLNPLSTPSVGGSVTTSPANAPGGAVDGSGSSANSLKAGGDKLQGAATGLDVASKSIEAAGNAMTKVAASFSSKVDQLITKIDNVSAKVDRLESYEGE
jgi:hypothetical protein